MKANLTRSPSRRRPPLFSGSPAPCAGSSPRAAACASSSRSAVVSSPCLPRPASTSDWRTHCRSADSVRSRSRATSAIDRPALDHQPDRLGLELLRERPTLPSLHDTHIRLFQGVHENGSRPTPVRRATSRVVHSLVGTPEPASHFVGGRQPVARNGMGGAVPESHEGLRQVLIAWSCAAAAWSCRWPRSQQRAATEGDGHSHSSCGNGRRGGPRRVQRPLLRRYRVARPFPAGLFLGMAIGGQQEPPLGAGF